MILLRLVALVAFAWYALHGPLVAVIVSGAVSMALFVKGAIADPELIKEFWPGLVGALVGLTACWGIGFLLVAIIGKPETVYVGPGFDRWNLPGTVIGATIWVGATAWGVRHYRSHQKS
jgi:hypothetical protein